MNPKNNMSQNPNSGTFMSRDEPKRSYPLQGDSQREAGIPPVPGEPFRLGEMMPNRLKLPYSVDPRKLPSGRWKGRVVVYDATTGKRREMTHSFDTKKDAKNGAEKRGRPISGGPAPQTPQRRNGRGVFDPVVPADDWSAIPTPIFVSRRSF